MAHLQYFSYAGVGERKRAQVHYNQAVRIGDRIETAGQCSLSHIFDPWSVAHDRHRRLGPETGVVTTDLVKQIEQTFANVDLALRTAGGAGWREVYRVRIYYTRAIGSVEGLAALVAALRKWCPDHFPILTGVEVAGLANPGTEVEIEVAAHVLQQR
ncbi:YjgF-like protein [Auricularia subglabra TFB-10046 SS5]|nr:YjgF-like protein [Auricularia subglabra TFB-10046 SS5]